MSEYIPKDKVLELWWYWKFIEAYDQTKAMKGIDLDDYVPREWHDRVCEEMAKRHTADRPQGKWLLSDLQYKVDNDNGNYAYVCTNCDHTDIHAKTQKVPYCWWCGARMKGVDNE